MAHSDGSLIFGLVSYVIYTIPLFMIALKSGHPYAWLAWIPIADIWLMCDMADLELAWCLLLFLPCFGLLIFQLIVWMRIAENTNKPSWLGILMVMPLVNLPTGYYLAFVDTGRLVG